MPVVRVGPDRHRGELEPSCVLHSMRGTMDPGGERAARRGESVGRHSREGRLEDIERLAEGGVPRNRADRPPGQSGSDVTEPPSPRDRLGNSRPELPQD